MACNLPIVSTNVGDIKEVIGNTKGCFITSFDPNDISKQIYKALNFGTRTYGRANVLRFESNNIALQIKSVYEEIFNGHIKHKKLSDTDTKKIDTN